MSDGCPFCTCENPILEGELSYARMDLFPVSDGHVLIIPKRHVPGLFDLTEQEVAEMFSLLMRAKELIDVKYSPDGYNVGVNVGESAGQTIWHVHIHLIPRRKGDVENPRGGVRGVIPSKKEY